MNPTPDTFDLIEPPLGRGGMGVVWRARNRSNGQVVALKRLHAHLADEPEYVQRFEREIELARRINSPHTVRVFGFGVSDGVPFAAMELIEGESLRELLLRAGPLPWERARPIIDQIAAGLRDAHAQNVIHRDIKPSNVLVQADGTVKVADFGISRALDMTRLTGGNTMLGTPAYAPPDGEASEAGDYYSLGCVAYELLTGAPPFEGTSQQELWLRHLRAEPDLSRLPKEARPLVSALLTKDPKKRLRRIGQLTDWFGGSGVRSRRKRPDLWVAGAAGGLLLVAAAAWSVFALDTCACSPAESSGIATASAAVPTPTPTVDALAEACRQNPGFHGDGPNGPVFFCNEDGTVQSAIPDPPTRIPTVTPTPRLSPSPTRLVEPTEAAPEQTATITAAPAPPEPTATAITTPSGQPSPNSPTVLSTSTPVTPMAVTRPVAPSGASAQLISADPTACTAVIRISWLDNSNDETGFAIGPASRAITRWKAAPNVTSIDVTDSISFLRAQSQWSVWSERVLLTGSAQSEAGALLLFGAGSGIQYPSC